MASAGDYEEAIGYLQPLITSKAYGQDVWAICASALRYAERRDEYTQLIDYEKHVGMRNIEVSEGYENIAAFLRALREYLSSLHITHHHPVGQSLQYGTQTLHDLFSREQPVLASLKTALATAIKSFADALPSGGEHPVTSRLTGQIKFSHSWSVLLKEKGFHKYHFHSHGWLSSAFYITVPDLVSAGGKEVWIKFGEPGFHEREPPRAEHWIQPQEGVLAIFPSYLWHGTDALQSDVKRMTVGFDFLPATT